MPAVGLLAGVGALAIPGLGPFIAAGPIMAALNWAAVETIAGGVVDGLVDLSIPNTRQKPMKMASRRGYWWLTLSSL
ncbi:MAG TPA: hypothetical protein VIT23_02205 [Terrimicrobiaceae bacterium]